VLLGKKVIAKIVRSVAARVSGKIPRR
jgi:hypothetical protein